MVNVNNLQASIVSLIGGIAFPEQCFEETGRLLENNRLYAQSALFKNAWLDIHNPEFLISLQDGRHPLHQAYNFLSRSLLGKYVSEAINCQTLYNYLRSLELFLQQDSDDRNPALTLTFAEGNLLAYLQQHGFEEKFRLRHRHLLAVWFLFPQFIHNKPAVIKLLEHCPELKI